MPLGGRAGMTICPESLIRYLGKSVAVRPILHPMFRSRTILVWCKHNGSALVRHDVSAAKAAARAGAGTGPATGTGAPASPARQPCPGRSGRAGPR